MISGPKDRLASAIGAGQQSATVFAGDLADVGGDPLQKSQLPGDLVEVKAETIKKLLNVKSAQNKNTPKGKDKESE